MKFGERWLRQWINPSISSKILYEQITNSGIEIDSVNIFEPLFSGIVVGKIVNCIEHITVKNIKILKVDIGIKKLLNIVCRSSNCSIGIKVAVAPINSILPNNIKIVLKLIYGEYSEGMLCSFSELGIFNDKKIIEFNKEVTIGTDVNKILLLKENIIKVSITPNRSDGLSILGIARNIAVLNNLPIPVLSHTKNFVSIQDCFPIHIQNYKKCLHFSGRIIKNINLNIDTPFWMKKKLFYADCLSNNVLENIINYVLIEIGQPLQVMNADKINSNIIVRMATQKEYIILKNDIFLDLNENILVFSDDNKILSIPGNINTSLVDIDHKTQNIFLSFSFLSKETILNINKIIPINKNLEYYRYGIDPILQKEALEYASNLIINICGGLLGPITTDIKNNNIIFYNKIKLRYDYFNRIVGFIIDPKIILNILYRLQYQVFLKNNYIEVIPPSWRIDILIEEDVISDIIRIYGYNNISLEPLKDHTFINVKYNLTDNILDIVNSILINKGYYEIITYGFIDPKLHNLFFPEIPALLILNPIAKDMSCMRCSLWPGLLKTVSYNKNRQLKSIRFFESGLCFSIDKYERLGIKQELFLGGVISGNYLLENWYSKTRKVDFYDLKGDLECILDSIYGLNKIEFRKSIRLGLHPTQSANIYFENKLIGCIGAIDPRLVNILDVNIETFIFEISLQNYSPVNSYQIKKISKFPTIRRDISILISENIAIDTIIQECKRIFFKKKVEINLFDLYSYKELSNYKKSVGISFIFQSDKKTLQDNEINVMINNCIGVLIEKFQVILRK